MSGAGATLSARPEVARAPLLEVRGLVKHFHLSGQGGHTVWLRAVDGVDLQVAAGETLGLVGESGCGKSTLAKVILGIYRPTAGEILFDGATAGGSATARPRDLSAHAQIIFQDPYSSLNPRMSIGATLAEPFIIHGVAKGAELRARVDALLERVGLNAEDAWRYPHEFSGGQRQRVGIARALALEPPLIMADEPVSSLDVSIQAQILNLLMDLREEKKMAYLFISHDLRVIRHISDRVAVMYLGRIVEEAPVDELFGNPLHPYTEALLAAIPSPGEPPGKKRLVLAGDLPSPVAPPSGCHFHPRCPIRGEGCDQVYPPFVYSSPRHGKACHYRG